MHKERQIDRWSIYISGVIGFKIKEIYRTVFTCVIPQHRNLRVKFIPGRHSKYQENKNIFDFFFFLLYVTSIYFRWKLVKVFSRLIIFFGTGLFAFDDKSELKIPTLQLSSLVLWQFIWIIVGVTEKSCEKFVGFDICCLWSVYRQKNVLKFIKLEKTRI